jgi:hypothetical protein
MTCFLVREFVRIKLVADVRLSTFMPLPSAGRASGQVSPRFQLVMRRLSNVSAR